MPAEIIISFDREEETSGLILMLFALMVVWPLQFSLWLSAAKSLWLDLLMEMLCFFAMSAEMMERVAPVSGSVL